jgi:branched-chain amino acid transport system ATP-binding protein
MSTAPILAVQGASVVFGALRAVDDVSIRLAPGERHGLLGTNGAGKTTLFNAITGEVRLSSGAISFRGRDISALSTHARARLGVARTFQSSLTFGDLSVRENLMVAVAGSRGPRFGLRPWRGLTTHLDAVLEAAQRFGLEPVLDREVATLSYGQQREVEVAMAFVSNAELLLLDEPAAGLAPHARQRLISVLRALPRSVTILFVEHDMDVALSLADRVSVMRDGVVVSSGTPEQIRRDPLVREIYLGRAA